MRTGHVKFQIGKNGVTGNFISGLENAFKNRKLIKVQILKSAGDEREKIKEVAGELIKKMKGNYSCRVIGFTITIRKKGKQINKQVL